MAVVKWIKITDIFDDEKFNLIRTDKYFNEIQMVWIKLLCLVVKRNEYGYLMVTDEIPYTDGMLSDRFGIDVSIIEYALNVFQELGMIEIVDDVHMVSNWKNSEQHRNDNKERQERCIENQKKQITPAAKKSPAKEIQHKTFATRSNVQNLKYVIENKIHTKSEIVIGNQELYDSMIEWMSYKDNKKPMIQNHYDSEQSIKSFITKVLNNTDEYGTSVVVAAINDSIANNYQGIVWDALARIKKKRDRSSDGWGEWENT